MEEKYFMMDENSNLGTTSKLLQEYRYIYSFAYCLWLFCTLRAKVSSYEGIWPIKPSFFGKGSANKYFPASGSELPKERLFCLSNQILYNPRRTLCVCYFGAMPRIQYLYQLPQKIIPQKILLEFSVSLCNRVRTVTYIG